MDLGVKLGQDGKLTPAKRAHQFTNNLCLFCSGVGHTARDCPKASKAKGRAMAIVLDDFQSFLPFSVTFSTPSSVHLHYAEPNFGTSGTLCDA